MDATCCSDSSSQVEFMYKNDQNKLKKSWKQKWPNPPSSNAPITTWKQSKKTIKLKPRS
jgi:hypothetical protein